MTRINSNFKYSIPFMCYDSDEEDGINEALDIIRKDLLASKTYPKVYRFSLRKETILSIFIERVTENKVFVSRMEWDKYSEEYAHLRNIEEKFKFRIPYMFYDENRNSNYSRATERALDEIKEEFLTTGSVKNSYQFYTKERGVLTIDIGSVESKTIVISNIVLQDENIILENPYPLLAKHFSTTCSDRLTGWITFIEKVMGLELNERVSLIRQYRLGKFLSYCAKIKGEKDDHILRLAYQMIDAMANFYFFSSVEWKKGVKGLENSHWDNPQVKRVASTFTDKIRVKATMVFAQDSSLNSLTIARSGRMWGFKKSNFKEWSRIQKELQKSFQKVNTPPPVINDVKMTFLTSAVQNYVNFFRSKNWQARIPIFTDASQAKGDFVNTLCNIIVNEFDRGYQLTAFNVLRNYHPLALPEKKWEELLKATKNGSISQEVIMQIVFDQKSTDQELVDMALTHLPCGEIKIAIDRCHEAYRKPYEETLGSQLKFTAYHITQGTCFKLDICNRCKQVWPAFEALYWSIAESGLNMDSITKYNLQRKF